MNDGFSVMRRAVSEAAKLDKLVDGQYLIGRQADREQFVTILKRAQIDAMRSVADNAVLMLERLGVDVEIVNEREYRE